MAATFLFGTQTHACSAAALDGGDCGGVGCISSFALVAPLALPLEVLQRAEIKVFRNAGVAFAGVPSRLACLPTGSAPRWIDPRAWPRFILVVGPRERAGGIRAVARWIDGCAIRTVEARNACN